MIDQNKKGNYLDWVKAITKENPSEFNLEGFNTLASYAEASAADVDHTGQNPNQLINELRFIAALEL